MTLDRLEQSHFHTVDTLEDAVRQGALMFAQWNKTGHKIRNPWRVALLMYLTTPLDLPNRDQLKTILDKWYSRLQFQAPELWSGKGHVWSVLGEILYKYTRNHDQEEWYKNMMAILNDRDRDELYT